MFEWITNLVEQSGYLGIVFGMFLENVFPPIPSELVMIFSGAVAGQGHLNIFLVILCGCIGSVTGLLPWYYAGKWFGQERLVKFADKYGRILTFSGRDVLVAEKWFHKHGKKITLIGRAIPAVRTFVAIPAAIMRMDLKVFLLFAFIGSLIWDGAFGMLGYYLGEQQDRILKYVDFGTYAVLAIVVIWYIYRVVTFKRRSNSGPEQDGLGQ